MDARLISLVGIVGCLAQLSADAYGVDTHQFLSRTAAQSTIALSEGGRVFSDLSLKDTQTFPDHEGRRRSILGLISHGAAYEDDLKKLKMRNHFFDPQHGGRPLTIGVAHGHSSPDWILEDRGPVPDIFPRMLPQNFSLRRAREYFLNAVTYRERAARDTNFGLLFQSLGHMVHHIQDMAQPEHVRNDQHIIGVDTSYFESWTSSKGRSLPVTGYPPLDLKVFRTARSFWINQGKGLAEFVSHNFVSKDTNFRFGVGGFFVDVDYPLPTIPVQPSIEKIKIKELLGDSSVPYAESSISFVGSSVGDAYRPALSRFNQRASTFSFFGPYLLPSAQSAENFKPFTALNRFNFAAAHQFVIPRAVAYSAGLIDYFFRGQLAIDAFEVAGNRAALRIRNASAADFVLAERVDGEAAEFSLYYDAEDGMRHRLPLSGDDLLGQSLPVGATRTLSFLLPDDLSRAQQKPLMLVFDGIIGEESGIAALALESPSRHGLLVTPNYVSQDGVTGKRLITYLNNDWQVSAQAGAFAGNVDWRGDEPGEVLTWQGPPSRYFYPDERRGGYSTDIYYQGRRLTAAPANVQGASIRRTETGQWLNVVTYQNGQLRLYSRPLRAQYINDGAYHSDTNPDGWRPLYSTPQSLPYTPTFFNASGTEAQLITTNGEGLGERVRLRLSADTVTKDAVSAVGAGQLVQRDRRTVQPTERALNAGRQEATENATSCRYSNVCSQEQQCAGGANDKVCLLSEVDYASENTATVDQRREYVFERPTTLCVDYHGDEEVLCQIAYRDNAQTFFTALETDRFEHRHEDVNTCAPIPSQSQTRQHESYRMSSNALLSNTLRVLRIGSLEIPLSGLSRESAMESERVRVLDTSTNAPASHKYSGTQTQTDLDLSVESRLLYVDARNAIVVYETDETKKTALNRWQVSAAGLWEAAAPSDLSETINRQLIAVIDGQTHSIRQNIETHESTWPLGASGAIGVYGVGRPDCTPVDIDQISQSQTAFTDKTNWSAVIHPRAHESLQGWAVDHAGRVAASQTIWVRQPNGTYQAQGVWNFLSGGDLRTLFPPAPAQASFFPVGVIG